ncbi:hypothetical protein [Methylocapsa polymorpha]|uniref:hypothetical protein n=1 Tax=Methylocapsa polymorpha TaxID=3080828 RepID=UPI00388D4CF4
MQSTLRHSWHVRRLQDLPLQGAPVIVRLRTGRWRCRNEECGQKTFVEKLTGAARLCSANAPRRRVRAALWTCCWRPRQRKAAAPFGRSRLEAPAGTACRRSRRRDGGQRHDHSLAAQAACERADENAIYPQLANLLSDSSSLFAMSRAHREILHLARLLSRLVDGRGPNDADRSLIRDGQRIIEAIESRVRIHNGQEQDIYENAGSKPSAEKGYAN